MCGDWPPFSNLLCNNTNRYGFQREIGTNSSSPSLSLSLLVTTPASNTLNRSVNKLKTSLHTQYTHLHKHTKTLLGLGSPSFVGRLFFNAVTCAFGRALCIPPYKVQLVRRRRRGDLVLTAGREG